jgi:hypothetical protein
MDIRTVRALARRQPVAGPRRSVGNIWTAAQIDDPIARCLLPGFPRVTDMPMPTQISESAKQACDYDGRKHPDDVDLSFMGDSVEHWEGDTLVVDVTGFNDKT